MDECKFWPRAKHGVVGAVLYQRVLKDIGRIRRCAAQEHELSLGEPDQRVLQDGVRQAGDGGQHLVGKFASDGGADLQRRAEAVDARHQRGLKRTRNRQRLPGLIEHIAVAGLLQLLAFEHGLGEFLDKEGHAVVAIDDLIEQPTRKFLASGNVGDQRCPLALRQPTQRQHRDMRLAGPGRLVVRTKGDNEKDWHCRDTLDRQRQQFERRWIGPMHVFEQDQHRSAPRQRLQPFDQPVEKPPTIALRIHAAAVAGPVLRTALGKAEKLGEERRLFRRDRALVRQHRIELWPPVAPAVVGLETGGVLQPSDDRGQRAALVLRLAEIAQADMSFVFKIVLQCRGEAGLSDAGLAGQEHHAAFAVLICCQRRISRSISSSRPTSG
ncbi:MAG: hypothetical protein WBF47_18700, partial [Xanthobacteraceae bacterium]